MTKKTAGKEEKFVLIKNTRDGVIFATPKSANAGGRAAKGIVFQKGTTEVLADDWEALRPTLKTELASGEIVEMTVERDNGQTGAAKKVIETNADFKALEVEEQIEVIADTMDTKTLKKWSKMKGLDASVVVAAKDQIEKIKNWTPESDED